MRSGPGCRCSWSSQPPSGGPGRVKGSPGYGAASSSRQAAVSRSDRVSTWCTAQPSSGSPAAGAQVTRPREVFRPTTPQADAGILIEPPPSEPVAIGTMPRAHRGARPAARAAGHVVTAPGRAGGAAGDRLGGAHHPELGRGGAADRHHAAGPDTSYKLRLHLRHPTLGQAAAGLGGPPGVAVEQILQQHRDAMEGPRLRGLGRLHRVVVQPRDRAQSRLCPLRTAHGQMGQLGRRHLPLPHELGQRQSVVRGVLLQSHRRMLVSLSVTASGG